MNRRRQWLALVAALALVLGSPGTAAASFGSPSDLFTPCGSCSTTQTVIDASGRATVVWQRDLDAGTRIQTRTLEADGTLGPVRYLSPSGDSAESPQVAVNASGQAAVVWVLDGLRVQARAIAADGTLGSTKNLTPAGKDADDADVVVDSTGRATVVWNLYDGSGDLLDTSQVQARTVAPDGTLGSTEPLSKRATNHSGDPSIAIDADDRVTVAWKRYDGSINRVQARTIDDGTLSSTKTLSAIGQNSFSPETAVDPAGRATVVWKRTTGDIQRVTARMISADGSLGPITTLSPAGEDTTSSQVAVDSAGRATVIWERNDGSNLSDMIRARTMAVDGTLGSIKTLTTGNRLVDDSILEIDSTDRATVVWEVGDADYEDTGLLARSIAANGTLSTIEPLTPEDNSGSASLAGDSSGRVTVVWNAPGGLKYARSNP